MRSPKHFIAISLFSSLLVSSLACSGGNIDSPQVKIIGWRCEHNKDQIVCRLDARMNSSEDLNGFLHTEFQDESGKVINTCEKCQQRKRTIKSVGCKEESNMFIAFALASDSTLYTIITTVHADPEIKKYKFEFNDETSNKIISNTVEGAVFEPQ